VSQFQNIIVKTAPGEAAQIVGCGISPGGFEPAVFQQLRQSYRSPIRPDRDFRFARANAIAVANDIYKAMAEMSKIFPKDYNTPSGSIPRRLSGKPSPVSI